MLFNDTIAANIAYGRPGASRAEIEEAARVAQIHSFIETLPEGYETVVGERGLKLSGGEKQRVAIARVVLKNPPIWSSTRRRPPSTPAPSRPSRPISPASPSGRTTLVIAHRFPTVVDADEIVVLEAGRIVERGTHAHLLARPGLYHQMWTRQQESPEEQAAE